MTTQQHNQYAEELQRYEVMWNDDGHHISRLRYTDDQIDDINDIVDAIVKGIVADKGLDITVQDVPYDVPVKQ